MQSDSLPLRSNPRASLSAACSSANSRTRAGEHLPPAERRWARRGSGSAHPGAKWRRLGSPDSWRRSAGAALGRCCPLAKGYRRLALPDSLWLWADAAAVPTPSPQTMLLCLGPPRPWRRSEDADLWWGSPLLLSGLRRHLVTPAASSYSQFLSYTAQPRPFPWASPPAYRLRVARRLFSWRFLPVVLRKAVCGFPPLEQSTRTCSERSAIPGRWCLLRKRIIGAACGKHRPQKKRQ